MVRNMAGTLLEVGRGTISLEEFQDLFVKRDRNLAGFTAPAHGLVLLKVISIDMEPESCSMFSVFPCSRAICYHTPTGESSYGA